MAGLVGWGRGWQAALVAAALALCSAPGQAQTAAPATAAPTAAAAPSELPSGVVFMYRRFGEDDYPAANIEIAQFEAHVAELSSGRYKPMPLADIVAALAEGKALPDRAVAITVDDPNQSFLDQAWPRFKAARLPVTLFLTTDAVDKRAGGFGWDDVKRLADAGVGFGTMGASGKRLATAPAEEIAAEANRASEAVAKATGQPARLFSWPWGESGLASRKALADAGMVAAFGQQSGPATAGDDLMALPRFVLTVNHGGIDRFRRAANALPLPVSDVLPADSLLGANPPSFGFTVAAGIGGLNKMACFASHENKPVEVLWLGETRAEIRFSRAFPTGRGRVNCTLPTASGRYRWLGRMFVIPGS